MNASTLPAPAPTATPAQDLPAAPEVRVIGRNKPLLQGRCIGILFDEGSDARVIANLRKSAEKAGASVKLVAPKVGGATLSDGRMQAADGQLAGTPSVVFDAVAVVLSADAGKALAKEAAAVLGSTFPGSEWYQDSYFLMTGEGQRPPDEKSSWFFGLF
mgnify:CR=1 FL=1